jgi:hypothetical protein
MGMGFRNSEWLGGYGSWPRRMIRLGHIAMIMLGMLNILFAVSSPRIGLPDVWTRIAAGGFLVGAVLMPLGCFLAAMRPKATSLLVLPVIALIGSGTITWVGLLLGWLAAREGG